MPAHKQRFAGLMMRCMGFVMGKLGAKGVFHNTLLFSGRFLVCAIYTELVAGTDEVFTGFRLLQDIAYRGATCYGVAAAARGTAEIHYGVIGRS